MKRWLLRASLAGLMLAGFFAGHAETAIYKTGASAPLTLTSGTAPQLTVKSSGASDPKIKLDDVSSSVTAAYSHAGEALTLTGTESLYATITSAEEAGLSVVGTNGNLAYIEAKGSTARIDITDVDSNPDQTGSLQINADGLLTITGSNLTNGFKIDGKTQIAGALTIDSNSSDDDWCAYYLRKAKTALGVTDGRTIGYVCHTPREFGHTSTAVNGAWTEDANAGNSNPGFPYLELTTSAVANSFNRRRMNATSAYLVGDTQFYYACRMKIGTAVDAQATITCGGRDTTNHISAGVNGGSSITKFTLFGNAGAAITSTVDIDTNGHTHEAWRTGGTTSYRVDGETAVTGTAAGSAVTIPTIRAENGTTAEDRSARWYAMLVVWVIP